MIPLRDINPTRRRPLVTYALVVANLAVFGYQVSLDDVAARELIFRFGVVPHFITQEPHVGALITPVTSMFMHGGIAHLVGNLWFLHVFGDNVEDVLGRPRFVVFYLLCGILAAGAQTLVNPDSRVPMIGASGAIAGVLGAYIKLFPGTRVVTLIPIFFFFVVRELPAVFFIFVWFAMQFVLGVSTIGRGTGVAFFAHVGGFVAGVALLGAFMRNPPQPPGSAGRRGYRVARGPRRADVERIDPGRWH
ncbi:MAG: rhomboid family intramembrane serine protease [Myxococcales bacterium]